MVTDPIANMLVSIVNGQKSGKEFVLVPYSRNKEAIARVLADNGYTGDVKVETIDTFKHLKIKTDKTQIDHIKRISKSGRRVYRKSNNLPRPLRGRGLVIVSTSKGIMTGKSAYKNGLGGEIICEVF